MPLARDPARERHRHGERRTDRHPHRCRQVLESTTYNYVRGGATLLEVLEAQRTVDDVYLVYYQALTDHAHALIAVELAAGIWDLRL